MCLSFFFQAEDGIRDVAVTGVQTCALPIWRMVIMSCKLGNISESDVTEIKHLIELAKLPTHAPEALTAKGFKKLMAVDKKVQKGKIRLILLNSIGDAYITDNYDEDQLTDCINCSYC